VAILVDARDLKSLGFHKLPFREILCSKQQGGKASKIPPECHRKEDQEKGKPPDGMVDEPVSLTRRISHKAGQPDPADDEKAAHPEEEPDSSLTTRPDLGLCFHG
jgi:hypothetical protein